MLFGAMLPFAAVVVYGYGAPAQAGVAVECAAAVNDAAVVFPAARADFGTEAAFARRFFAGELDDTAGVARAAGETGRTAHQGQAFVDGAIGVVQRLRARQPLHICTVNAVIIKTVAAHAVDVVTGCRVAPALMVNARRLVQCLSDAVRLLLVQLFFGDDGYRLRCVFQRDIKPCRGG